MYSIFIIKCAFSVMSMFRKSKKIIKQTMVMGFLIVTKNRKKIIKNNGCGDGSF